MTQNTIPVQVRLRPETLERIDALKEATGRNRTQVIVDAIALYERLLQVHRSGGCVLLEKPNGRTVQVEFVGFPDGQLTEGEK